MCLILLGKETFPGVPMVIAANRDEFLARPTAPAGRWPSMPDVVGGRDLEAGGTWLAVSRSGRWAAVTNVREPDRLDPDLRSRGDLVRNFVAGNTPLEVYSEQVERDGQAYNGFNLLLGEGADVRYISNRAGAPRAVSRGIHGLSNAALNTPWPKVERGTSALAEVLKGNSSGWVHRLFAVLGDAERAPDDHLPETGVGIDLERSLSPICIRMDGYGTRCSTVVLFHADGTIEFVERSYPNMSRPEERRFVLRPE